MISVKHLTVSVGNKEILHDISYTFQKGKVYVIMGPNGSGKSTLAYSIMGHPSYILETKSKVLMNNKNITPLSADKRSKEGVFLSFQSPLALTGVKVHQLLHVALSGVKDPLAIRKEIQSVAKELHIPEDLLKRPLNDGTSGGEKKKLEVLQASVLGKPFLIFDEVDTGVDIDALRDIAHFLNKYKKNKTYIVITHYNRILKYLKPDVVLIMVDGRIVDGGDYTLAEKIEKEGYTSYSAQK